MGRITYVLKIDNLQSNMVKLSGRIDPIGPKD
jgi:hypothetical protein